MVELERSVERPLEEPARLKLRRVCAEKRDMASDRSRYGLLVSALGAVLLAISVFLPWYAVNLTPDGATFAANAFQGLASEFGNASLQQLAAGVHGSVTSLSGQEIAVLSAHQVLHDLGVVLLVLAAIALLDALMALARELYPRWARGPRRLEFALSCA